MLGARYVEAVDAGRVGDEDCISAADEKATFDHSDESVYDDRTHKKSSITSLALRTHLSALLSV
jgi:hypothetical protein